MNAVALNISPSVVGWPQSRQTPVTGAQKVKTISDVLDEINASPIMPVSEDSDLGNIERQLREASTSFKVMVSRVSMHLGLVWLKKLFEQVDSLLDSEEWDSHDPVPSQHTARTFVRLLLVLKVSRKPGLGISNSGNLVAAWTSGNNRLTVECLPDDRVRWVINRVMKGETERAAGEGRIERLRDVLSPYEPSVWFEHAE